MTRTATLLSLLLPAAAIAAPVPKAPKPEYDPTGRGRFVVFLPDGGIRVLVAANTGIGDGHVFAAYILDPMAGRVVLGPLAHERLVWHAAFSGDGTRIATASEDKTAVVWDAATGDKLATLRHDDPVNLAVVDPTGAKVAVRVITKDDGPMAVVWDVKSGGKLATLHGPAGVNHAVFSPDGARFVTTGIQSATVWDAATGKAAAGPLMHGETLVPHAAFSPDGAKVVTACWDGTAVIWDAATGGKLATLRHGKGVRRIAYSPDGNAILTTSDDYKARVWDAKAGKLIAATAAHGEEIADAAFSPDRKRFFTAGYGNSGVAIWDATTGQRMAGPFALDASVRRAVFSPDGSKLVTADLDRTAKVWDANTGKLLGSASPKAK